MKLQLLEAYSGGHYTNYIENLLPAFVEALLSKQLSEVVISVTPTHYEQFLKLGLTSVFESEKLNLRFDSSLEPIGPANTWLNKLNLYKTYQKAIQRERPDVVLRITADYDLAFNALLKHVPKYKKNWQVKSIGVLHYGFPRSQNLNWKEYLKQIGFELCWRYSSWDTLFFVNPVVYESAKTQKKLAKKSLILLPDPVPANKEIDVAKSRLELSIPIDGIYIGFVGMMDGRKAIPELLEAFKKGGGENCRLLLMGSIDPKYSQLIKDDYQDLVDAGKLIIFDRHLTAHELQLGYAAIDIHALVQYRRMNLSANLLKAIVSKKIIIVDDCGYTGMMTKRFKLGETCNVGDVGSFVEAIKRAKLSSEHFKPSKQAVRLAEFHHPDNFSNTIMKTILQKSLETDNLKLITWDWVCEDD